MKIRISEYSNVGFILLFFIIAMQYIKNGFSPAVVYVFISVCVSLFLLIMSKRGNNGRFVGGYICFVISLWFFSPFIRRYGDFFHGWSELNLYGLAPIAASLLAIFFINRNILRIPKVGKAWALMVVSLIYALVLGVVNNGLVPAMYSFLTWLSPLVIFIYIISNYLIYETMVKALLIAITVGVAVLSAYGIYQYLYLPAWDQYWMVNVPMTSVGRPFPMEFRSFSLSNSPMVYAPILSMLLIAMLAKRTTLTTLIICLGMVSLFLTLVRAAWLGIVVSFILYFIWLYRNNLLKALKYTVTSVLFVFFLTSVLASTDAGQLVVGRMESLFMLGDDVSFNERAEFYDEVVFYAITNFFGDGMGSVGLSQRLSNGLSANTTFDNGILEMLVTLGWFGTLLYITPFLFFFNKALIVFIKSNNHMLACFSVIVISMFIQMVFSNRLIGPIGFFYFLFFGFLVSGYIQKYHISNVKSGKQ